MFGWRDWKGGREERREERRGEERRYLIAITKSRKVAFGGSFQYSIAMSGAFTFSIL
jgi:hypothetical protein